MARNWEDVKADRHGDLPKPSYPDPLHDHLHHKLAHRHEATRHIGQFFTFEHLIGVPRAIARLHAVLFCQLLDQLPDGPEFTAAARKLVETKDCAVRHTIVAHPEHKRETTSGD